MRATLLRRLAIATAAAGVVAAGAATVVRAQDQAESARRIPGWSFTPGLTTSVIFDSNVALVSAPADTRKTQGDQLFIVQPFGTIDYLSRRTEFSGGYRGYLRRYMEVDQLNGFDQHGRLSVRHMATRHLSFFLADEYSHVPTTDEVELNGVPFTRTGAKTNTLGAGVESQLTRFTTVAVRYDLMWVHFDRPASETVLTGGFVNAVRGDVRHRITQRLGVGAEYGIRFADLNEGARQITFQDAGGTLSYALGPHTDLSLAGGVSHLVDHTIDETHSGPFVRAGVTNTGDRATIGASYERSFVPSFGFGGSNQSQQVRTFIRMPFEHNRLYVDGSLAWRRTNPFFENELRLDTIWLRSTVGYGLTRWFRLEGFYAFTRQDSQVTGGEINRHRAGVQVVVSQPMRIR